MSVSREIITIQAGNYANFIGTHWWNMQVKFKLLTNFMCFVLGLALEIYVLALFANLSTLKPNK